MHDRHHHDIWVEWDMLGIRSERPSMLAALHALKLGDIA
jgi:hypothetical protein